MPQTIDEQASEATDRRGNRFTHSWSEAIVIAKIIEWNERFGNPPAQSEWNIARARKLLAETRKRSLRWVNVIAEYERGDWPSCDTVKRLFGSWNAAVTAAGFEGRPSGNTPSRFKIRHKYSAHLDALADIRYGVGEIERAAAASDVVATRQAIEDLASIALAWLEHFDKGMPNR